MDSKKHLNRKAQMKLCVMAWEESAVLTCPAAVLPQHRLLYRSKKHCQLLPAKSDSQAKSHKQLTTCASTAMLELEPW
jgi:hypothetical protein